MTLQQKKALILGLVALLPAYFFANWRLEVSLSHTQSILEREQQILESDMKLLSVCKETGLDRQDNFGSNAVLCRQAQERHKSQETVFEHIKEEEKSAHRQLYLNFMLVWLIVNVLGQMALRWAAIQHKLED